MPVKKGKGKKKGGKKAAAAPKVDLSFKPELLAQFDDEKWITLHMKLLNWGFGSFDLRVRTDTPIVSIKRQLVDRHGRMADLRLFIGQPTGREIQGEFVKKLDDPTLRAHGAAGAYEDPTADPDEPELATLEHWGLQGKDEDKEPVAEETIWYDFRPYEHDEPLLLADHPRDVEPTDDDRRAARTATAGMPLSGRGRTDISYKAVGSAIGTAALDLH